MKFQESFLINIAIKNFIRILNVKSYFSRDTNYFIKVGANDGLTGDPFGAQICSNKSWIGDLIEPIPFVFEQLKNNFSDGSRFRCHMLGMSLDKNSTNREIFFFNSNNVDLKKENLGLWVNQIANFDIDHVKNHIPEHLHYLIESKEIELKTLSAFIFEKVKRLPDLLHIDVSGNDFNVLKTYDFEIGCPRVIMMEVKHLDLSEKKDLKKFLKSKCYKCFLISKCDYLAFINKKDFIFVSLISYLSVPLVLMNRFFYKTIYRVRSIYN